MSPEERIMATLIKIDKPEKGDVECIYCDTIRDGSKGGYCPNCGGTVTKDMGPNKTTIGKVHDVYWSERFDPEKVVHKDTISEFYERK